jgi:hypothetical protein
MTGRSLGLVLAFIATVADGSATITVQIDPAEPPGTGFTDPTPVAAIANGNPGTTRGAQRLYVFQTATSQWGKLLNSSVPIVVRAQMTSIAGGCGGSSAVLGQAGPDNAIAGFPNAPKNNVFYSVALADSLAGIPNDAGNPQIDATFNVDIDTGTCLTGNTWSYDTNAAHGVPSNKIPLLPVVFHELGHGLGFITFTNLTNGSFIPVGGGSFLPDIWNFYLFDQAQNKTWEQINPSGAPNATIVNSAKNDPNLVWAGKHVNRLQRVFLDHALTGTHNGCMRMYAPNPLESGSSVAHWTKASLHSLLMQPYLNETIFNLVDMTLLLFQDVGWSTNIEDSLFYDGFDPNPCASVQP